MKKLGMLLAVAVVAALAISAQASAATQTWKNVRMVDTGCAKKKEAATEDHASDCVLNCSGSGLGIFTETGYLKFDAEGNKKAIAALKKIEKKKEDTRVTVIGTVEGDIIKVDSITVE